MERACNRVKGGRAKSCLACGRVKQQCVGLVWEGGDGLNGVLMAELTGLVRELVGEMKGFREELREVKEVVDGPGEEARPKKRAKTAESNAGPSGEPEMEAAETACKR